MSVPGEVGPEAPAMAQPFSAIPRMGWLDTVRNLVSVGGGRVDMFSMLRKLHDQHGDVVIQAGGPLRFVNLFGPDANRVVLLDADRIF